MASGLYLSGHHWTCIPTSISYHTASPPGEATPPDQPTTRRGDITARLRPSSDLAQLATARHRPCTLPNVGPGRHQRPHRPASAPTRPPHGLSPTFSTFNASGHHQHQQHANISSIIYTALKTHRIK